MDPITAILTAAMELTKTIVDANMEVFRAASPAARQQRADNLLSVLANMDSFVLTCQAKINQMVGAPAATPKV